MKQIVQCEVIYTAVVYVSGNELLGDKHSLGEFDSREEAATALVEEGLICHQGFWTGYCQRGFIERSLKEIK